MTLRQEDIQVLACHPQGDQEGHQVTVKDTKD